ncbi:MAG: ATP-binding protein [Eubacteriales bacterium]
MIRRDEYLNQLIKFKDKEIIKVVTGIRRCGKSTLFELYIDYLLEYGVEQEQIIMLNLEDLEYDFIDDAKKLHDYIARKLQMGKMNYIFIDEVQRVPEFQKAVDSLFIKKNCDVYITGSNAYLLSSELATLLSGRYVEIKMLPLSFQEYISVYPDIENLEKLYLNYTVNSSFPYAINFTAKKELKMYLDGIIDSILLKDVITRGKFPDIEMLKSVLKFGFDNIGNMVSINKIANTMISAGRKIAPNTVESYMTALTNSFIFYDVKRYDIKGKQYLKTGSKYYVADIGLRYALLGSKPADDGHILENVVYLELLRRGYEVYIGKVGNVEVDFVAINDMGIEYYQVAYTVREENTLNRELGALDMIKDHNPKYLLTMDQTPYTSHNGIKQINALEWLLYKDIK